MWLVRRRLLLEKSIMARLCSSAGELGESFGLEIGAHVFARLSTEKEEQQSPGKLGWLDGWYVCWLVGW